MLPNRVRLREQASRYGGSALAVATAILAVLLNLGFCYLRASARTVVLLAVVSCALVVVAYVLCFALKRRNAIGEAGVFLAFLIVSGVFYLVVFTPFSVPDEFYHYQCAYKYSDALLFQNPTSSVVPMRGEDAALFTQLSPDLSTSSYSSLKEGFHWVVEDGSLVDAYAYSVFDLGQNPPQLKIPAALGITVGRLLGLGAYPVFYLGRIFNFAYFAVLAYLAVRFTPFGKRIFAAVSYLPMTLHLVTSYSYDAGIIGLAMLLTALCLKAAYGEGRVRAPLLVAIAVVAALLAPCKVIYSLVILLVPIIPASRFSSRRVAWAYKAGVFVAAAVFVLALRLATLADMAGVGASSEPDARGEETGAFYSVSDFLANPLRLARLLIMTFGAQGDFYLITTVGGSLGWFQPSIGAPFSFVLIFAVLLLLAVPRAEGEKPPISRRRRLGFLLLAAVGWFLVMMSLCVAHTFNTEEVIQGVQGRYILPLLPLALLAFQGSSFTARRDLLMPLSVAFAVMNSIYLTRIYALALLA